jgi:hypothetical protein
VADQPEVKPLVSGCGIQVPLAKTAERKFGEIEKSANRNGKYAKSANSRQKLLGENFGEIENQPMLDAASNLCLN